MNTSENPSPQYGRGIEQRIVPPAASRAAHQQPEKKGTPAAPVKRAAWRGSQSLVDSGQHIAAAVINRKDLSYLQQYVDDIYSADDRVRDDALSVLVGISATLASIFETARNSGKISFTGDRLLTPVDVHYAARTNFGRFEAYVRSQIEMLEKLFKSNAGLTVSIPGADGAQKADTPPITEPLAVRVVSLPPRHTLTSVEYDMAGQIVGSDQIERDL
jgi:hypothetical protein